MDHTRAARPVGPADDALLDLQHWESVRQRLSLPQDMNLLLLRQAFCHASFAREVGWGPTGSNQRLEFLGDAVLDLILVEYLYLTHDTVPEGKLTKMKASVVRAHSLARVARQLGLGEFLLLARGEEETGGREKPSLLADCLEALVGAVYLSTDLETTARFVLEHFGDVLHEVEFEQAIFDYKTALQELLQNLTKRTPTYQTVQTLGPPHNREFVVQVHFSGCVIGEGRGRSKQAAQQAAAQNALQRQEQWAPSLQDKGEGRLEAPGF